MDRRAAFFDILDSIVEDIRQGVTVEVRKSKPRYNDDDSCKEVGHVTWCGPQPQVARLALTRRVLKESHQWPESASERLWCLWNSNKLTSFASCVSAQIVDFPYKFCLRQRVYKLRRLLWLMNWLHRSGMGASTGRACTDLQATVKVQPISSSATFGYCTTKTWRKPRYKTLYTDHWDRQDRLFLDISLLNACWF